MTRRAIPLAVLGWVVWVLAAPLHRAGAEEPAVPAPASGGPPQAAEAAQAGEGGQGAFSAAEPSDRAAEYPEGLVHTVVEGDTLWDLSAKYLGTPWKWPVLWDRNRFLTNPHYIYPGIRLEIFPPPPREYAAVPAAPAAAPAVPPGPAREEAPPAPASVRLPLLAITPAELVGAGEFVRERPRGIGSLVRGLEEQTVFAAGDKVYLALDKDLPAGQMLGVYRVRGPVKAPADRSVSGYVKYLVGVVQLLPKENGVPAGRVRAAFEELRGTDILAEEIPAYAPVALKPGAAGVQATVIAGRGDKVALSSGDFIYLSRGAAAGVEPGHAFRLLDRIEVPGQEDGEGGTAHAAVARAVVVKTSPEFSTAYVVESRRAFSAGITAVGGEGPAAE